MFFIFKETKEAKIDSSPNEKAELVQQNQTKIYIGLNGIIIISEEERSRVDRNNQNYYST